MRFTIRSKAFAAYIWFITILVTSAVLFSTYMVYSMGYELSPFSKLLTTVQFIWVGAIFYCLAFTKGPIKFFLYALGLLLIIGGLKTAYHQYFMQVSVPQEYALIQYLVGFALCVLGLCVVLPLKKVIVYEAKA